MTGRRWHYVKPNETTTVPRRFVFLDSESASDLIPGGHEQRFGLAVANLRDQRPDRTPRDTWACFDDPDLLWRTIDQWCNSSGRTVLWCHNLAFDARITEMFTQLPGLGWVLVSHNLAGKGCWLMWRKGRASLTMVDSTSVFPCELIRLGLYLGLPKLKLPDASAGGVGLYSRCWRDVEILRKAVLSYVDWLEREDMGNWQLTGAGQSWATFRHRFMDVPLLVHDDAAALAAERRAMWTGRCEAYWHGEIDFQVVHEWDFSLAYTRIARDVDVPIRLLGPMPEGYDALAHLRHPRTAILAECEVTTEQPVVPTVHEGRIVWPVGTFTTTLWDVEIVAALEEGATVVVRSGWLYRKGPALKAWATWIIAQLERLQATPDHWLFVVLKHQARALIGRCAMTYTQWEPYAVAPRDAVRAHNVYDAATGETFRTMQIGRSVWRDVGTREWDHSTPMVTGYVQAHCRVRLWKVLKLAPAKAVLYADTDGFLVTDRHTTTVAAIAAAHPEWGLRLKRSWQGFAVWGPRQIRTGPAVRVSGVPHRAARVDRRRFAGEIWESLPGALVRGHPGRVRTRDRVWEIKGVDHRRHGPPVGWTHPHRLPARKRP